jgi:hypothetical protein
MFSFIIAAFCDFDNHSLEKLSKKNAFRAIAASIRPKHANALKVGLKMFVQHPMPGQL